MTESFVWISVDPNSGERIPYSTDANLRLESALGRGDLETSVLIGGTHGVLLVRVLLQDEQYVQVTSSGGQREVMRLTGEEMGGITAVRCKRVVWTSLDPVRGDLVPYLCSTAQQLEDAYSASRESVHLEIQTPAGPLSATICFSLHGHHQQTASGFRSVFRHLLEDGSALRAWRLRLPENGGFDSGRYRLCEEGAEGAESITYDVSNVNSVVLGETVDFPSLSVQGAEAVAHLGISEEKLSLCRSSLTSEGLRIAAQALYQSVNVPENLGVPVDRHLDAIVAAWKGSGAVTEGGLLGPPCVTDKFQDETEHSPPAHRRVKASLIRVQAAAAIMMVFDPDG